jgi:hypothetical protein
MKNFDLDNHDISTFDGYVNAIYRNTQDNIDIDRISYTLEDYGFTVPSEYTSITIEKWDIPAVEHHAGQKGENYDINEELAKKQLAEEIIKTIPLNTKYFRYTGGIEGILKSDYLQKAHDLFLEQAIENL